MALSVSRLCSNVLRRQSALAFVRASSGQNAPSASAVFDGDKSNAPVSNAEKLTLLSQLAGNEDPFEMNVKKRVKGTFKEPTLIPSITDRRMVGCICEEEAVNIKWMMLTKGKPKECDCGYWFRLVELSEKDDIQT